jgi:hypothetical protein
MRIGRILGLLFVIVGIGCLSLSYYINAQVEQGREKIAHAQKNVNVIGGLFSITPVSKEVGQPLTGAAQHRIDQGIQEAEHYAKYVNRLLTGGVALIVIGIGVFFIGKKKHSGSSL